MQKDSHVKKRYLISLYTSYYLNKISLSIFVVTLALLSAIFFISTTNTTLDSYLPIDQAIHEWYFNDAFFALLIVVAIFSCFLGTFEVSSNINRVDIIILGKISRNNIFIFKTLSFILINTLFYILVFLVLFTIPILRYERFTFKLGYMNIFIDMLLWGTFITLFSMLITTLLQNYFSGLLAFIIFFISKIMSDGSSDQRNKIANIIFPQLFYDSYLRTNFLFGRIYVINYIIILILGMYLVYTKKNL